MWREIRRAAYGLRQARLFTLAVAVVLGVGIGASATIFGFVDGLWLRPPGIEHPASLVRVFATTPTNTRSSWSFDEYLDIAGRARALNGVVAVGRRGGVVVRDDGTSELVLVNVVSLNFFTALGLDAAQGRAFTQNDERALDAEPAVVLGYAYWQRAFGGDPRVIGGILNVERGTSLQPIRILGVLPKSFRDLNPASDRDLWMPVTTWAQIHGRSDIDARDNRWFEMFGRLAPRVSVEQADAEIRAMATGFVRDYPAATVDRGGRVQDDASYRLERVGSAAVVMLALVLILVAITSVNVAQLLLSRAVAQRRELAVRVALGASRGRVLRERLIEVGLLGALGAAVGLAVGAWLLRLLPLIIVTPPGMQAFAVFALDSRVLIFTLAIALFSTVVFGLAPSWTASRADVATLIKAETGGSGAGRRFGLTPRSVLLIGQIAVSLALVYAAAMLVRSFEATRHADLGFTRSPVLTVWVPFGDAPRGLIAEAQQRLEALPGVEHVAAAIRAPLSLSGGGLAQPVVFPDMGATPPPSVKYNAVSSSYFQTMGTRLLRGRLFNAADEQPGDPVVIVNDQFAKTLLGGDAVGKTIRLGGPGGTDHRVIGVVENSCTVRIGERAAPYFYLPFARARSGEATLLVATRQDLAGLGTSVRDVLIGLDRRLAPRLIGMLGDLIDYSSSDYRAIAALASLLGALGLLLTTVGVYGVIAARAARRTREVGIRIALGATRGQVLRLVHRDGVRVAIAGIVIGAPLALGVAAQMGSMLFAIAPRHWLTLGLSATILAAAVSAATLIPAWRATRVQPGTALRDS